jgi:hypothetical protein
MSKSKRQSANADENSSESRTWTPGAPRELVERHGKISKGRDVLGRLLQCRSMARAWREIDKRIDSRIGKRTTPWQKAARRREEYYRLWGAIVSALQQANRNPPSAIKSKRNYDLKIARKAERLAQDLYDTHFDALAHDLFPADVVRLARQLKAPSDAAVALEWTTLRELLCELAARARADAKRRPVVAKHSAEYRSNWFVRTLEPYFTHHFGGPMAASLAAISSVVLERRVQATDVKRALKR